MLVLPEIDREVEQRADSGDDAGGGLVGGLIFHDVGRFFVEGNTGDGGALVSQLAHDEVGSVEIGRGFGGITANFKDEVRIKFERLLSSHDSLIVNAGDHGKISIAAARAVRTGGDEGGVGNRDSER